MQFTISPHGQGDLPVGHKPLNVLRFHMSGQGISAVFSGKIDIYTLANYRNTK
jgi:hypothetical protein